MNTESRSSLAYRSNEWGAGGENEVKFLEQCFCFQLKASTLMAAFMANKQILFRYEAEQEAACEPKVDRFLVK